jgi:hypothetical protein
MDSNLMIRKMFLDYQQDGANRLQRIWAVPLLLLGTHGAMPRFG